MQDFVKLVEQALGLESEGKSAAAVEVYRQAAALVPGHGLPFTKLSVAAARRAWGPPPRPRPPAAADAPRVSMSRLGELGRFGNQLLQYAYLRSYAEAAGCGVEAGDWIGRDLFGLDDPLVSRPLPRLAEGAFDAAAALAPGSRPPPRVDLAGFFSLPTAVYAHRRDRLRALFELQGSARAAIDGVWRRLDAEGRTLVAVHLRRGDFGYDQFWIAPLRWYREWLAAIWPQLDKPLLYVASDDASALQAFAEYAPVGLAMLGGLPPDLGFLGDFFVLSRAAALAIANSSFSFVAAMLNTRAQHVVRPDPAACRLVDFDPWNAHPLLDPPWRLLAPPKQGETAAIAKLIGKDAVVFDVGAGRGTWSRHVQSHCRGAVRIFAFEPDPTQFGALSAFAEMSRPGGVTAVAAAVAARPGMCILRLPQSIAVRCVAIDDFCREHGIGHIDFLRVDVDGAEREILEGCRGLLPQGIDCVQFAYSGRDGGSGLSDVVALLQGQGYRLRKIDAELTDRVTGQEVAKDRQAATYLAIHARLAPQFDVGEPGPRRHG